MSDFRYRFKLYTNLSELENQAFESLCSKDLGEKAKSEFIRRLILSGFALKNLFEVTRKDIPELKEALEKPLKMRVIQPDVFFNFRLSRKSVVKNSQEQRLLFQLASDLDFDRGKALRELFLYGYWFEGLYLKDSDEVNQIFGTQVRFSEEPILSNAKPSLKDDTSMKIAQTKAESRPTKPHALSNLMSFK